VAFGLEQIHWQAPWLAPYASVGQNLAQQAVELGSVAQALNQGTAPVRFVPQAQLPGGMAYEAFIFAQRQCPTRDGLHDFFNGLVWWHLPRTKQLLNQWQAADIAQQGVGRHRGPLRDALTLFDENVALLACPDLLWQALERRDWQALFVEHRPLWANAQLRLFGHALMEKLVAPRKGMCAHVLRLHRHFLDFSDLDELLCDQLSPQGLAEKPYQPLPVLGVPGWWSGNETSGFYEDAQVFRPHRSFTARNGL
jgi:hypothetical protein